MEHPFQCILFTIITITMPRDRCFLLHSKTTFTPAANRLMFVELSLLGSANRKVLEFVSKFRSLLRSLGVIALAERNVVADGSAARTQRRGGDRLDGSRENISLTT